MNTSYKSIEDLDDKISEQSSVVRYTGYNYVINGVKKYIGYAIVFIGISFFSYGWPLIIIGLIFEAFATKEANQSYKNLQSEERKLIELQARRSAIWTEMMSKE